jgi:hypothetical protein
VWKRTRAFGFSEGGSMRVQRCVIHAAFKGHLNRDEHLSLIGKKSSGWRVSFLSIGLYK